MVEPAAHSLGAVLGVGEVDEDELYRTLDLLGAAQPAIEKALARRRLKDGMLVLYDVTSSYLEGRCCELARFGYSRDGRSLQLLLALMIAVSRRRPPCPGPLPAGTPLERKGDSLVAWRLDRLGRSLKHLIETITGLGGSGLHLSLCALPWRLSGASVAVKRLYLLPVR